MANEKVLGVVSGTRDGKLLVVTTPTRCDEPVADEVYLGLVSGTRNGKPIVAISTQRCDPDDELADGQTYLGLVSGTRDGKLLLAVPCGNCEPPNCREICNRFGGADDSPTVVYSSSYYGSFTLPRVSLCSGLYLEYRYISGFTSIGITCSGGLWSAGAYDPGGTLLSATGAPTSLDPFLLEVYDDLGRLWSFTE